MKLKRAFWICFIAFSLPLLTTASQWVVETNSLSIKEPSNLQGEYDAAIGDFGVPLYGASMQGQVKYVASNQKGCNTFGDDLESAGNVILLVLRGDCYFVEKAYNAEKGGARAVLVMDDRDEQLLTMAAPEDRPEIAKLREDITIPTALISKGLGKTLKQAVADANVPVIIELDWTDSVTNPDDRVEWELWTSSNDGCGNACEIQIRFKKQFRDTAVQLEKAGNTQFTPHYNLRKCTAGLDSVDCKSNCIHYGRYCAVDSIGESFKDTFHGWQIVEENKRQLCVYEQAKEAGSPWLWWDFVGGYSTRCTFENGKFNNAECGKAEIEAVGLDSAKANECMADSWKDKEHTLLQALSTQACRQCPVRRQQFCEDASKDNCVALPMRNFDALGGNSFGGARILLLPTVIINGNQYRGRLDRQSIVRALCAGFSQTTEPEICLSGGLQTDECAANTHSCWQSGSYSACVDTFRGYKCECPKGFKGDGTECKDVNECAEGTALCDQICINEHGGFRCACNEGYKLIGNANVAFCNPIDLCKDDNGGCEGRCLSYDGQKSCSCGKGLRLAADKQSCVDIDECAEASSNCEQLCENKDPRDAGVQYVCKCKEGYATNPESPETCVQQTQYLKMLGFDSLTSGNGSHLPWPSILGIVAGSAALAVLAGFVLHKWRMQRMMQSEIQSIMRQYMPLEGNNYPEDFEDGRPLQSTKSGIKAQYAEEQC